MNGRRLYEEIGGVNERYLQQAAVFRARRKKPVWRTVLIAAALVLVGALLAGTLALSTGVVILGSWVLNGLAPDAPDVPEEPAVYSIAQMEQALVQRQDGILPVSEKQVPLFSGDAQLVWTDGESGDYYRISLNRYECESILYLMQQNKKEIHAGSEQPNYQVWISLGDGMVVSPYLKATAGNAGHGELFDYDPELELSEPLIRQIMECVQT